MPHNYTNDRRDATRRTDTGRCTEDPMNRPLRVWTPRGPIDVPANESQLAVALERLQDQGHPSSTLTGYAQAVRDVWREGTGAVVDAHLSV